MRAFKNRDDGHERAREDARKSSEKEKEKTNQDKYMSNKRSMEKDEAKIRKKSQDIIDGSLSSDASKSFLADSGKLFKLFI